MIVFCWYFWPFTNCSQQVMKKNLPANPSEAPESILGLSQALSEWTLVPSVCASVRRSSFLFSALSHPTCSLGISYCLEVMSSAHLHSDCK